MKYHLHYASPLSKVLFLSGSDADGDATASKSASCKVSKLDPSFCFEDHLFHGRVQLLKKLYSGKTWGQSYDQYFPQFS
jgi:hypothetical protein